MTCGNRRLQRIPAVRAAERFRSGECGETATDEEVIPSPTILIEKKNRLSGRTRARGSTRGLNLHQRYQSMHLRFIGHELRQDAAEAKRILAELRAHPVVTGGRRVTLVENQVDDFEH